MRLVSVFKKMVVVSISVVLLYGCASGKSEVRSKEERQTGYATGQETRQEAVQNTLQPSGNVLREVGIEGDRLKLIATDVLPYNIINTTEPLKKIVELKGVEAGNYKDRLIVGREDIVDVSVREDGGDAVTTVLEIRLGSPLEVSDVVSQNTLLLVFKAGEEISKKNGLATNGAIKEKTIVKSSNGTSKEARFITGVSFKKESATHSRVEVSGDGPIAPDVFTLDGRIVVDIPKVRLATVKKQHVKRPLGGIRWVEHKDKVRIVLDVAEKVNYEVVTGGNVVDIVLTTPNADSKVSKNMVTVLPAKNKGGKGPTDDVMVDVQARIDRMKEDTNKPSAEKGHKHDAGFSRKGLVTLDFNNADIVPIMRLISDVSGYNIVVDPAVKGKITLKLKDVPWDKALELILDTHRLDKEVDGNILKIKPKETVTGAARCSSQPVVIKDLTITFSNIGGAGRSLKRENVESGTGNICLDLNINLDSDTGGSTTNDMGEKGDRSKKGNKH
ncbi:MAG: AMIN domain-containing protein [Nitrospirae bacterium]|nr:AMIN domain-containing protein [Nitrospirota bacterium]